MLKALIPSSVKNILLSMLDEEILFKSTVMQIEKALTNDRLRVSKVS